MSAPVSRLPLAGAAVVGFCVPFILFLYSLLFFGAPQNTWWVELLARWLPTLLCPALLVANESEFWLKATPFINAPLYALIAYLYLKAKSLKAKRIEQMAKPPV